MKDRWDKFEIASKFGLAAVGAIWAVVGAVLVLYHEDKALERQLQDQAAISRTEREISEAQLATALLPRILDSTEIDRVVALEILSSVAPQQAARVSEALMNRSQSASEQKLADEIRRRSTETRLERALLRHLETARTYQNFGLDAQAVREYLNASQSLPQRFEGSVNRELISQGRLDYERGEFRSAARRFEDAFREVFEALPKE